jgi:hypothetical protein
MGVGARVAVFVAFTVDVADGGMDVDVKIGMGCDVEAGAAQEASSIINANMK